MISQADIMTVDDVAKGLGVSPQTAVKILADLPSVKIQRSHVYDPAMVRKHIAERNAKVLQFLGFPVDLSESYDANNVNL